MALDKDGLLRYMESELAMDTSDIDDQTPLISSGIIDSFGMATLITHLEQEGGFRMNPDEVNLENLDTIERMLAYVEAATKA